jgi:hypothetical protein
MIIPKVKINRGPQFPVDRARRERWVQELFEKFLIEPTANDIQYITSGDAMVLAHRVGPMINFYEMTITGEGVMAYRGWENMNAVDDELADAMDQMETERLVYDERADPRKMWPDWEDA